MHVRDVERHGHGSAAVEPEQGEAGSAVEQRSVGSRRRWRRAGLFTVAGMGGLFALAVIGLAIGWAVTPSVGDLGARVTARLAAHDTAPLAALPNPDRVGVAMVATEDARFYHHPGIDPIALARVAFDSLRGGADPGGSTLDLQLAKILYPSTQDGLFGLVERAVLALKIDHAYSKPVILRDYLSTVYYGNGYYGLGAAAQGYFGATPSQLSWAQASMLAGLVQAPSAFDPVQHWTSARERQHQVLARLVATGAMTGAQAEATYAAPLRLVG